MIRLVSRLGIFLLNTIRVRQMFSWRTKTFILKTLVGAKVDGRCFVDYGFDCLFPYNIHIKDAVSLGHYNRVWAFCPVIICQYVQTAFGLTIVAGSHYEDSYAPRVDQAVVVGPGCWVGANVTIIGGVRIGRGCIIGAGSVVVNSIPEYSIAAGVPARVLRPRKVAEVIRHPFGNYTKQALDLIEY
jgi:acetyltransferase-like isoleucine patch superfamily enzyme